MPERVAGEAGLALGGETFSNHAEGRVGDRFSLADGAPARRLEPFALPEREPAFPAFRRNLLQPPPLRVKAFPKVLQVIFDLLFRSSDGEGDLLRGMRTFLQERADLASDRFLFHGGG